MYNEVNERKSEFFSYTPVCDASSHKSAEDIFPSKPGTITRYLPSRIETNYMQVEPKNTAVNNPFHYNRKGIEAITAIEASMTDEQFKGYLKGNIIKYMWRYDYKNGLEDLQKAQWYLNKLVETLNKSSPSAFAGQITRVKM